MKILFSWHSEGVHLEQEDMLLDILEFTSNEILGSIPQYDTEKPDQTSQKLLTLVLELEMESSHQPKGRIFPIIHMESLPLAISHAAVWLRPHKSCWTHTP